MRTSSSLPGLESVLSHENLTDFTSSLLVEGMESVPVFPRQFFSVVKGVPM